MHIDLFNSRTVQSKKGRTHLIQKLFLNLKKFLLIDWLIG